MNFKAHKFCKFIGQLSVKCEELMRDFPPKYDNPRKKAFYEKAAFCHRNQKGIIKISRVEFSYEKAGEILMKKNDFDLKWTPKFYDYQNDGKTENDYVWYVNFADPVLFGYYDGDLFVQDEIQTLEMPLLASSMHYLDSLNDENFKTLTVETVLDIETLTKKKKPKPYLLENVPHWISVNTMPKLKDGSTVSIYGRNFRTASDEAIENGLNVVQEEIRRNIIAIAAPVGRDSYKKNEIFQILETLISSFSAAVKQTKEKRVERCVIHSGNWGCGAFGGNLELAYLCQLFAASVCGVDELHLHGCNESVLQKAKEKYKEIKDEIRVHEVVDFLMKQNYQWNESDGN